jgi:dienelactone hydrolase
MPSRRAFVAGSIALAALPTAAAKRLPPPKIGAIYWPGAGRVLHGYMAIPAKAHGPQPAILVLPGANGADRFAMGLTDALAVAGFVACLPKAPLLLEDGVASVRWLATNRYATGKVAAVGVGEGAALVQQLSVSSDAQLSCAVIFGNAAGTQEPGIPILRLPAMAIANDSDAYVAAWREAVLFLSDQLQPQGKHRS